MESILHGNGAINICLLKKWVSKYEEASFDTITNLHVNGA